VDGVGGKHRRLTVAHDDEQQESGCKPEKRQQRDLHPAQLEPRIPVCASPTRIPTII
jgi:hypothetical protein